MMHREFHAQTQPISLSPPGETQTSTSGLSPILTPGFWRETSQYPLKEELNAINELADGVRGLAPDINVGKLY